MSYLMTAQEFVDKARTIATQYKTLYVMGCFGAPMTAGNKQRYIHNGSAGGYNAQTARARKIDAATTDTFGFDCVGLIKGILWGWHGDASRVYGGSGYACNGVPDIDARGMINACDGVSTAGWTSMLAGEPVWMDGHIGIYIGDGLCVESSPVWKDGVQITAVANIGKKPGVNARKWTKHGRLPWVDYSGQTPQTPPSPPPVDVQYRGRVTAKPNLRVRTSPNLNSSVVGTLPYGATVQITREQAGWGYIGSGWCSLEYIEKIIEEVDDEMLSYEQFKDYMEQYRKEVQSKPGSGWSENDRNWAVQNGLFQGGSDETLMWQDTLTREQAAALFHREAERTGRA